MERAKANPKAPHPSERVRRLLPRGERDPDEGAVSVKEKGAALMAPTALDGKSANCFLLLEDGRTMKKT